MLRDVADSSIGMLPHGTGSGLDLARQTFNQSRLARAVRADARDARREGHLDRRLLDRHFIVSRVLEGDVDDLDEGLALGLDACDENVSMLKFNDDAESAPSIGPGRGKWNLSLLDLSSK